MKQRVCPALFLTLFMVLALLSVALIAPLATNAISTNSAGHSAVMDANNPECLGTTCGSPNQEG